MMEGAGFEVIDLGIDVPAEKFIQAIEEEYQPQLVGIVCSFDYYYDTNSREH